MALEVVAVPAFADNYLWLIHDDASGRTAVVDPGDGEAVLAAVAARVLAVSLVPSVVEQAASASAQPAVSISRNVFIAPPKTLRGAGSARAPISPLRC